MGDDCGMHRISKTSFGKMTVEKDIKDPGSPSGLRVYADALNAGEKLTIERLELPDEYSYTEDDINNFLTVLPVTREVLIWKLSAVPLTNAHWKRWSQINGQWQYIRLRNGQLQSNQLKHFGQIAARTKLAVLSNVKFNNFEEFSSSFTEELHSGGNCEEVRFYDSTAEEWGKELKRLAS